MRWLSLFDSTFSALYFFLFLLSVPFFLFHLELFPELLYTKDMANLRRSATNESEDTYDVFNPPTVAAKVKMVICGSSYADPAKTKVIGKVVRYTNIHEAPIPELLNEDGKLIDTGQIIIAQKLQLSQKRCSQW